MIDLSNPAVALRHEKAIEKYINERISDYFGSKCYKILRNRKKRISDSVDMKFHNQASGSRMQQEWIARVSMPMVREAFLAQRAVMHANFTKEPLFSLEPEGETPYQNALDMQELLNVNLRVGKFEERVLTPLIKHVAEWGTAVAVQYWRESSKTEMRTTPNMVGGVLAGYQRKAVPRRTMGAHAKPINQLNYFQDPNKTTPWDSDYRGWIESWSVAEFMREAADSDVYIKKNVQKVLKEAKENILRDRDYTADNSQDLAKHGLDVRHWYGRLNIKGNEDDVTSFYAELIDDTVVRVHENANDGDMVPITCFSMDRRNEFWWGNSDNEAVIPYENYLNTALNMEAQQGLQQLQNFIFYDKSMGINPADINNRAQNGGFIPFDRKQGQSTKDLFTQCQWLNNTSFFRNTINETKEASQRMSTKADLTRNPMQGGPQNKTATAAAMVEESGDIAENYYLRQFSYGLQDNGEHMAYILQQRMPEAFKVRGSPKSDPRSLLLMNILGDFGYRVANSLTKNKQAQAQNLLNTMTFIQNMRGTGDPSWMRVNLPTLIRSWFSQIGLPVDMDQVYPEVEEAPAAMAPPQGLPANVLPAPGAMQGAMQGAMG